MAKKIIRRPSYDAAKRPFMIIWEVTQACDLACKHCRASAWPKHRPGTLSFEEGKALLEEVEHFGTPRPILVFTGGDPFKRRDLFELLKYAKTLGLVTAVSPSGTPLLNHENLKKIKETGSHVISLSIDGGDPATHDSFRGVDGSLSRTLKGWDIATSLGLKVQINTTITRQNLLDLPNIFKLIISRKAFTWSAFFLVPTGRGKLVDQISPDEYEAIMNVLYDCSKYVPIKTTEGHHYKRIALQRHILAEKRASKTYIDNLNPIYKELSVKIKKIAEKESIAERDKMRRSPMHINSANGFVFISYKGEICPSGFLPLPAGNVRNDSLIETYRESELFKNLRNTDSFLGRCGKCEFSSICGGSRSRAYALTGNPLEEEPYCNYTPSSFPFPKEAQQWIEASK